ncbi:MAG TPA: hypothetical protein VMV69_00960 [Pirellulales bacterium]|nr:hypothetical protein [Pirellulales bacterium]
MERTGRLTDSVEYPFIATPDPFIAAPDLNDGVVLNIAPLWELVPWKEAKKYWQESEGGQVRVVDDRQAVAGEGDGDVILDFRFSIRGGANNGGQTDELA